MADNVFNENEEFLIQAREDVKARDELGAQVNKLKADQKKLSKSISQEEKSIADEISSTIKKRRKEIEDTYDDRIDDNRSKKKKVANKKDKKKTERVNERIEDETKHISHSTKELKHELKTVFKKDKVPGFCANKFYYSLFSPKGFDEILTMLISYIIYFVGIPSAVAFGMRFTVLKNALEAEKIKNMDFWCVVIAAVVLIVLIGIIILVWNFTKNKHRDAIAEGREIMNSIKKNNHDADAIKKSINKDTDESQYNLEAFDEKLKALDDEADAIGEEKKAALKVFEEETKQVITDEINGRRLPNLENMKTEKAELEDTLNAREKEYSDMLMQISNKYASYLGEDLCKQDKLTDLIALMDDGQASTVSEAISLYKG